ncbi:hypothetical protein Droror1_Dr00027046 [Drosera rotundifolia]
MANWLLKKCFLCQGFVVDQIASGHLRIVASIVTGAKIDWAFILLSLWKKNIEEVKTNPKKKTYLRMISFYLHKLGNYKGKMEFLIPPASARLRIRRVIATSDEDRNILATRAFKKTGQLNNINRDLEEAWTLFEEYYKKMTAETGETANDMFFSAITSTSGNRGGDDENDDQHSPGGNGLNGQTSEGEKSFDQTSTLPQGSPSRSRREDQQQQILKVSRSLIRRRLTFECLLPSLKKPRAQEVKL